MTTTGPVFATDHGPVKCEHADRVEVHHVGYAPEPWNWADWEFARSGRFQGRWDDPDGHWRAKYVGAHPLACYLEVLAPFRPDPELQAAMQAIESDDEQDDHSTVEPGTLDLRWCDNRMLCTARLTGDFALPGDCETLPTLREKFLTVSRELGVVDVDAAAVRLGTPRALTQSIAAWFYGIVGPAGERIHGVQYESRHGDHLVLWSIFERGEGNSPPEISDRLPPQAVHPEDASLAEAMRIHRISWRGA